MTADRCHIVGLSARCGVLLVILCLPATRLMADADSSGMVRFMSEQELGAAAEEETSPVKELDLESLEGASAGDGEDSQAEAQSDPDPESPSEAADSGSEPELAEEADPKAEKESRKRQRLYEKEREVGMDTHRTLIAQMGEYRDPDLQAYVDRIGRRVAAASSRPYMEFTFTILDSPITNAMAVPGGFIYLTRGMLAHMNSESELAAVLGHEIGHITERHTFRQKNRAQTMNVLSILAAITTGVYRPEINALLSDVLMPRFSREFELEADEVGAEFMARAGYETDAMLKTIEILKANERLEYEKARNEKRDPMVYHGFLSTHPDNDKRYKEAIEAAARFEARGGVFAEDDEFLEQLDGLLYGKSGQAGVVRRGFFYHPKAGVKFKVPDGWFVESGQQGVFIYSPQRDAALQLASRTIRQGMTPETFVEQYLRFNVREGQAFTVADMPGYIGIADRANSPFGLKPMRFAVIFDDRRRQAYVLTGSGKMDLRNIAADREFIAAIFSMDKMTREDYQQAKPPKIRVIRVEEGMTIASLAKESPLTNYAESELRVINGLYPSGEPEPGDLIKIIE